MTSVLRDRKETASKHCRLNTVGIEQENIQKGVENCPERSNSSRETPQKKSTTKKPPWHGAMSNAEPLSPARQQKSPYFIPSTTAETPRKRRKKERLKNAIQPPTGAELMRRKQRAQRMENAMRGRARGCRRGPRRRRRWRLLGGRGRGRPGRRGCRAWPCRWTWTAGPPQPQ